LTLPVVFEATAGNVILLALDFSCPKVESYLLLSFQLVRIYIGFSRKKRRIAGITKGLVKGKELTPFFCW
jgi:hypothetical protein